MRSKSSRPHPRAGRALARSLMAATILAGMASLSAEAAKFPVVVTQVQDPFGTPPAIPDTAPAQGMWRGVFAWPLNAVSMAILPSGKLVSFGSTPDDPAVQSGRYYDVWDPSKGFDPSGHTILPAVANVNSFCSTMAFQADGSLMAAGGIFEAGVDKGAAVVNGLGTGVSALGAQMAADRYYSTMLSLPDGRQVIMGGAFPYAGGWADPQGTIDKGLLSGMTPEVYDGTRWTSLFGANSRDAFGPENNRWWYPRAWVAPNGKVFGISSDKMWYFDPTGNGSIAATPFKEPQRNASSAADAPNVGPSSTAVMYDTGRILQLGGNSYDNGTGFLASSRATLVDITGGNPVLTETSPTKIGRSWANATVLPTGLVAVTGGSLWDDQADNDAVLPMELWDPKTGAWTLGPPASIYRGYHSTALLMQNGTILSNGGGAPGPVNNKNAEVYYPPYLFTSVDGKAALAPRPQILSLTTNRLNYGQWMQVEVTAQTGVSQVVLLGLGLVTHSFSATQRRMVLNAGVSADGTVAVQAPASANVAPPGYYQLVMIDQKGVPSPGIIVAIGPNTAAPPLASAPAPAVIAVASNAGGTTGGTSGGATGTGGTTSGTDTATGGSGTGGTGAGVTPTAAISIESASKPGTYVRRLFGDLMASAPVTNTVDRQEASFKLVPGLSGKGSSFQMTRETDRYLRHTGFALYSHPEAYIGTNPDGSFTRRTALAQTCGCNSGPCVSYESVNFPNYFVRVRADTTLGIDGFVEAEDYRQQASFYERPSLDTTLTPTPAPTANTDTTLLRAAHSGMCLAVPAGNASDGEPVSQQVCTGGSEQQWKFTAVAGGYTVVNASTGRCLDVAGVSQAYGAQVWQWSCNGGANQVWASTAQGNGVALVAKHSNQCLDVGGASTANGAGAIQWPCHGGLNQTFVGPQAGW